MTRLPASLYDIQRWTAYNVMYGSKLAASLGGYRFRPVTPRKARRSSRVDPEDPATTTKYDAFVCVRDEKERLAGLSRSLNRQAVA